MGINSFHVASFKGSIWGNYLQRIITDWVLGKIQLLRVFLYNPLVLTCNGKHQVTVDIFIPPDDADLNNLIL